MTEIYFQRTDGKPICNDCAFKPKNYSTCSYNQSTTLYVQSCKHYEGLLKRIDIEI